MENLNEILQRFAIWHMNHPKFRDASMQDVAIKLGEEYGEFCRALDDMRWGDKDWEEAYDNLQEEAADIILCVSTILLRYFPLSDIAVVVEAKARNRMGKP